MKKEEKKAEDRPFIRYEKLSKEDLVDYCNVYWRRIHNDEVLFNQIYKDMEILKEENKNLKEWNNELIENHKKDIDVLCEENKKLKERIDVLYEFIERNDKLVDEVIDEEDLDKLNRYIYIDDDLVDRTLESED